MPSRLFGPQVLEIRPGGLVGKPHSEAASRVPKRRRVLLPASERGGAATCVGGHRRAE